MSTTLTRDQIEVARTALKDTNGNYERAAQKLRWGGWTHDGSIREALTAASAPEVKPNGHSTEQEVAAAKTADAFQALKQSPAKTVRVDEVASAVIEKPVTPVQTFFESIATPLIARGWKVCPCYPFDRVKDGKELGKTVHSGLVPNPLIMRSNNPEQIHTWGQAEPNGNVCVYAVQEEGGLCFLDKDGAISLVEKYQRETGKKFPRTLLIQSSIAANGVPKGHWYFLQTPKTMAMEKNISEDKTGGLFSFRVNNFYVTSIGSIHPVAKTAYKIVDDAPVIPMPDDFLDWLQAQAKEKPRTREEVLERGKFKAGTRYSALLSEIGSLKNRGYSKELTISTGVEWAREFFDDIAEGAFNENLVSSEIGHMFDGFTQKGAPLGGSIILTGQQPENVASVQSQQPVDVSNWRNLFRSIGEMEDGPIDMIIDGVLQEGTCFIGANPGDGKTLVALAFSKAICTGTPLFGVAQYFVKQPRTVIYLIPESRDRAFRKRCEAFQIPNDKTKFMARTISAGVPLELSDPSLLEAVRETKAVVFLDTASRFMKGMDENAAAQNRQLVNDVVALLAAGAVSVVLVHHATKAAKVNQERMTLENMLRGTSDFGAMCDQAYGIRKDMVLYANGNGPMEVELVSLKDREQIGGLTSIRLAASHKTKDKGEMFPVSYINEIGNFRIVSESEAGHREAQALVAMVKADPNLPTKDIGEKLNITEYRVKTQLAKLRWHRVQGGPGGASPWHRDLDGLCPFEKVVEVKPSKKRLDTTVTEAVRDLEELLKDTSPTGDYVPETKVLDWADKRGITEPILNKAKRRLGVVVNKEGDIKTWALPEQPEDESVT
jgi:hypothetical protein